MHSTCPGQDAPRTSTNNRKAQICGHRDICRDRYKGPTNVRVTERLKDVYRVRWFFIGRSFAIASMVDVDLAPRAHIDRKK